MHVSVPTGSSMYKTKLWDEDKWNIHSNNYSNTFSDDRKDDKKYNEQKYGSKEKNDSSDYMRKEEEREKEEKNTILESEEEKNEKKEIKDEDIPLQAAKEIFDEHKHEAKKTEEKKNISSIEEAIKNAIDEEKKVIAMDD